MAARHVVEFRSFREEAADDRALTRTSGYPGLSADGGSGFEDRGRARLEEAVSVLAGELERAGRVLAPALSLAARGRR
jgi:hypothetical protein